MMTQNLRIKFERRFLLADLPAPLERKSEHLQYFDNYLTETRLLLRQIRTPATREWRRFFVQQYAVAPPDLSRVAVNEIELNAREYETLSVFEGNELRYNRYFYRLETGEKMLIDMTLNRELWNVILAIVEFADEGAMQLFAAPAFAKREITHDDFFNGFNLANINMAELRRYLAEIEN